MAEIQGAWVPENDAEMDFIMALNGAAQSAFEAGIVATVASDHD